MDEQTKQKVLIPFLTFNMVVIFYQLIFNYLFVEVSTISGLFVGVAIGLVAAGIVFGIMHVMQGKQ